MAFPTGLKLTGTLRSDRLAGSDLADTIFGNGGDDVIIGGKGNDWLDGGDGNDTFQLVTNDRLVNGVSVNNGIDTYIGGAGYDTIKGGAGSDFLNLSFRANGASNLSGIEEINGGDGNWHNNTILGTANGDVIDLDHAADRNGRTKIVDFVIDGGAGNDTIIASYGRYADGLDHKAHDGVILRGGAGDDTLATGKGDDIFLMDTGNDGCDHINAGAGYDTMLGGKGADTVHVVNNLAFFSGVDEINGGDGNWLQNKIVVDYVWSLATPGRGFDMNLNFDRAADNGGPINIVNFVITGADGNDVIIASNGHYDNGFDGKSHDGVLIDGGAGNDMIAAGNGDNIIWAGAGNDVVFTAGGNDWIFGGDGYDTLWAGAGNDHVFGGDGNDRIDGGPGNDWIYGGKGVNVVTGGAGSDTIFVMQDGKGLEAGKSIIYDFDFGQDRLHIGDLFRNAKNYSTASACSIAWVKSHVELKDVDGDKHFDLVFHTGDPTDDDNAVVLMGNDHSFLDAAYYNLMHDKVNDLGAVHIYGPMTYDLLFAWGP